MEVWVATRKDPHAESYTLGVFSSQDQAKKDIDPQGDLAWSSDKENVTITASRLIYPVIIAYRIEPFILDVS